MPSLSRVQVRVPSVPLSTIVISSATANGTPVQSSTSVNRIASVLFMCFILFSPSKLKMRPASETHEKCISFAVTQNPNSVKNIDVETHFYQVHLDGDIWFCVTPLLYHISAKKASVSGKSTCSGRGSRLSTRSLLRKAMPCEVYTGDPRPSPYRALCALGKALKPSPLRRKRSFMGRGWHRAQHDDGRGRQPTMDLSARRRPSLRNSPRPRH